MTKSSSIINVTRSLVEFCNPVIPSIVVQLSRQFGSLGRPIAKKLAELLEIECYDRDIVEEASKVHNIPLEEASDLEESAKYLFMSFPLGSGTTATQDALFKTESEMIKKLATQESCIIVGRCADAILEDMDHLIKIFIYAPYEDRIVNCVNDLGMDTKAAKRMIREVDKARDAYHMRYAGYLPNDMNHMDLMVNSAALGVDMTAKLLAELVRDRFS